MKKIVIAGGSGFLGNILVQHFAQKNYQVVVLTRSHQLDQRHVRYVKWDAKTTGAWTAELEHTEVLINLTGKSVDCRYTAQNKQQIYNSRLDATYVLGQVVDTLTTPPKLWINAASATIYRHALDREMDEETGEIGEGFSVDVCQKWERAFHQTKAIHTRKVALRIGIVLGRTGGALIPLKNLSRIGIGGKQGQGNQFFSWIHEKDFVGIVDHVIYHERLVGTYNVTSPSPVPNYEVMSALRRVLKVPFGLPMPTWLLTLGAVIIRTEPELILKSRRVVPKKLLASGYSFHFDRIELALTDLI
ncbi:TIGR01777 family protein [Reichenbachiella sp. 5M10]|uniref:TIGR01777 family oxidoreductase n=1 Tax=Reichenbachiella sp. 5M10 TaxID=1889772 RepID=UPI000C150B4D|nr:TIGR01777 family oxidoreductase [Reichenbachiella sp. 5M10]PIB35267.1 TIGR01777 family protein [Reichenbachiella sp. 5M10]